MRLDAVRAVFHTIEHLKIAPAFFSESIQRAVAEETVHLFYALMAGIKPAVPVRKEFI